MWGRSRARICGSSCGRGTRCRRCCSSSSRRSSSSTSPFRRTPRDSPRSASCGWRSSSRRCSAWPAASPPRSSRCRRSRSSSTRGSTAARSSVSRSPTSGSAPLARCLRAWLPRAARASSCCRSSSSRSRSRSSSAASARAWTAAPATSSFSFSTTQSLRSFPGLLLSTSSRNSRAPALAALALGTMVAAVAMIAYVAQVDADQGLSQKIFYFHVPIALTAYACFGWGAWKALLHLWKRRDGADLESYVAIHQGVIFGALTLVTGSIWAKVSWGHWWVWSSRQLVLFLILFLFYAAYFMLRFSIDFIHPTVFTSHGPQMSGWMFFTFCVAWAAMLTLAATLYHVELAGKRLDARLRELK